MARKWTHIRIPVELHARLVELAQDRDRAKGEGRLTHGFEGVEPLWAIVEGLLEHKLAKMRRSRARRGVAPMLGGNVGPDESGPSGDGRVNMDNAQGD